MLGVLVDEVKVIQIFPQNYYWFTDNGVPTVRHPKPEEVGQYIVIWSYLTEVMNFMQKAFDGVWG